jgi:hypothetical protein
MVLDQLWHLVRYQPFIGPILVRWEDYRKGNLQLAIGEYSYTRTEGRFTDEVVCRDVMGALVLLMNLQLENFTNKKNVSSDSSMFRIKKTTINQGIHVNSFGRVNKSFCQFVIDFLSMLLVFNAWSSHVSQTVPAPHVTGVPDRVYDLMKTNRSILVHYVLSKQVSDSGKSQQIKFVVAYQFDNLTWALALAVPLFFFSQVFLFPTGADWELPKLKKLWSTLVNYKTKFERGVISLFDGYDDHQVCLLFVSSRYYIMLRNVNANTPLLRFCS